MSIKNEIEAIILRSVTNRILIGGKMKEEFSRKLSEEISSKILVTKEESKDLETYIKSEHLSVFKEWERSQGDVPKVGERVITLVPGYSGLAGVVRLVREIHLNNQYSRVPCLVLTPEGMPHPRSICYLKDWWKEIKKI